jgi:hypothetical protein
MPKIVSALINGPVNADVYRRICTVGPPRLTHANTASFLQSHPAVGSSPLFETHCPTWPTSSSCLPHPRLDSPRMLPVSYLRLCPWFPYLVPRSKSLPMFSSSSLSLCRALVPRTFGSRGSVSKSGNLKICKSGPQQLELADILENRTLHSIR